MPIRVRGPGQGLATFGYLCPGPGGEVRRRPLELVELTAEGLPPTLAGLLLTADLQGRELMAPHRLAGEWLAEVLELARPEAIGVLLAGDFYANEAADRMGATGDVESVWRAFAQRFRGVVGVLGNHDRLAPGAVIPGTHQLDGQVLEWEGLRVAGISGIIGKAGRLGRRSPTAYLDLVDELLAQAPDVLVLHEAPALAELRGRQELTERLAQARELLVVCGHCHWPRPLAELGPGVQVLNVDARAVLLTPAPR